MEDRIGELAGNVWNFLESEEEASLTAVAEAVDAPKAKVNMALGWLAKEGKLHFVDNGRGTAVQLR